MRRYPFLLLTLAAVLPTALLVGGFASPPEPARLDEAWYSPAPREALGTNALLSYFPLAEMARTALGQETWDLGAIRETVWARLPSSLRLAASQTAELLRELTSSLGQANRALDETDRQVADGQFREAGVTMGRAEVLLAEAAGQLKDLQDVAALLQRLLPDLTGSLSAAARQRFEAYITEFGQLREGHQLRTAIVREGLGWAQAVEATFVALQRERITLRPGETVTIAGTLTSIQGPLSDRTVDLFRDGELVGSAFTGPDGGFQVALSAKPKFEATSKIVARYAPEAADLPCYQGSSTTADLHFLAQSSRLQLQVREAYPGKPLEVDIQVSSSR